MNKGIIAALLTLVIALPFTGFKLADPNAESEKSYNDNIVGVFITQEYVDLFDFDSFMQDNFSKTGNIVINEKESKKYEGRLYATYDEESRTFSFDPIEGILFASIKVEDASGTCWVGSSSEGLSDARNHINFTDEGEEVTLTGTIYSQIGKEAVFFMNPVYQDSDGNVYVVGGSGISSQSDQNSEGQTMSQTIRSEMTVNDNGEYKKHTSEITISINMMFAPLSINVLEFNRSGVLISDESYLPGGVPKEISPETETEYIVIETHKSNNQITREIVERKDASFNTFSVKENGICVKNMTSLDWE